MLYTSQLEPFGLAPLEANSCGTPVVAVAEGGVRETIKDGLNGFLVDDEPEAIAQAIKLLLSDAELARTWATAAANTFSRDGIWRRAWTVSKRICLKFFARLAHR